MKNNKLIIYIIIFSFTAFYSPSYGSVNDVKSLNQKRVSFLKSYPDFLLSFNDNILIWKDGSRMIFDDGKGVKKFTKMLNSPDLEDQLTINYPIGKAYSIPPKDFDPGRIRYEPFFLKMYGNNKKEVQSQLTTIRWLPSTVNKKLKVTTVNGVHKKLQAISYELDKLPDHLKKYVDNPAGTFKWRKISGTRRLSAHSFGIAIDINIKHSNYWRWDNPDPDSMQNYRNQIPIELVLVFEKYGFIWGGKWYHYDTMHFEYRPELLYIDPTF